MPPRPYDPDRLDARDPSLIASALPAARAALRYYARLSVEGEVPAAGGPTLYVGNHNNGFLGPEVLATLATLWGAQGPESPLYGLAHDFAMVQVPSFGALIQRFGAIRATHDNGRRALDAGAGVLVYPGGDLDSYRHWRKRDRVVFGPRAGFVKLAQSTGATIVPVVAHGAHRSAWVLSEGEALARAVRMKSWARLERFPVALALPWGVALGPWAPYLPLPFKVTLRFLPPMRAAAGDDPAAVAVAVQSAMQSAMDDLAARAKGGAR
ncbi:MAG: acyl-phosphate glycerol 3-phosphate acyltransferase [Polyangiales bacterium]